MWALLPVSAPLGPTWAPRWGGGTGQDHLPRQRGASGTAVPHPGPRQQSGDTRAPTRPLTCPPRSPQMLAPVRQALSAQKISFLLRAGVRVLVAEREVDEGESRSRPGPAWPGVPCWEWGASRPLQ